MNTKLSEPFKAHVTLQIFLRTLVFQLRCPQLGNKVFITDEEG
jgi:hypothetical protein